MAKLSAKKLTRHFWNEESGLTSIFIVLCISNFLVIPFFNQRLTILILMRITWFILLVAGITTLARSRTQMRKFAFLPVLLVVVSALKITLDYNFLAYIDFIIELSVFALLISMVLVKVFEGGSVTIHRVLGSIVAYMLIGNVWAILFMVIIEQLIGVLYPVVLIGRLVSLVAGNPGTSEKGNQ